MSVDRTPTTSAADHPAVLDVDVVGDRMLAKVDRGDVSVVVEAPVRISEEELEATLDGVPGSIVRTSERFAETTSMSNDTIDIDRSSELKDLSAEELREHYVELDDYVGHGGGGLHETHDEVEEIHARYMASWKELERRADDYPKCPECGEAHWVFEIGGPAHCATCGHMGGEELQIYVHEAGSRILEGGA